MIEVKAPYSGWKEVTREQAKRWVEAMQDGMVAIPQDEQEEYFDTHLLRGVTYKELMKDENEEKESEIC